MVWKRKHYCEHCGQEQEFKCKETKKSNGRKSEKWYCIVCGYTLFYQTC